ncbi:DeoR/GlpR family DNA-binding transcription regulator [Bradyrhizobium sp. LHD-71]|uniref:DeoR/GlpR family DNA-binding transcription regulator n=1 Tax=Bradyrhizobium sp. LHD-71 TaxID=3072141 RepID=UPI00280CDCD4|nr:DeoR/GlpR family DNA-binding transcription regulator [Bradyrhizobium sp. LHD-71]MDQ8731419.1 DeoR/GlpR family DNA-binding transcription regulator [Bradyrhizobium sp. LHD-71]
MNTQDVHLNMIAGSDRRQTAIAEMLHSRDFISVEELAAHFAVTTQTIRRDLVALCDQGLARRRHGGIESMARSGNLTFKDRHVLNREAKQSIAAAVAGHVSDGESLSLGIGTTPQFVAEALLSHRRLKIVTNNLPLALMVGQNSDFTLAIAGGTVRGGDLDVCGAAVDSFFASYKVDVAIFGVAGVDEDGSLLDFSEEEVRVREAMLRNCRRSYLVLDSSKFTRPAYVHGGRIDQVTAVFCEADPPDRIQQMLDQSSVQFVKVPHQRNP